MKHATSTSLHAYWRSRHGAAGPPAAGDIRAAELAPLLPSLFLLDLEIADGLMFRYCGATLATRFGRDLTGDSFLALWDASDRALLERDLRLTTRRSAAFVAGVMGETAGGGFTAFEMLILPLATGAIGSMARVGGHEETNRIRARLIALSLRSVRFLPAADRTGAIGPVSLNAPEPTTPSAAPRRYKHLTVVPGGRPPIALGAALTDP